MEAKRSVELTCPECRGPITEIQTGEMREYRCLVGHAYSPRSLLESHSETQERMLWAAVVALEETMNIAGLVASQFSPAVAQKLQEQAQVKVRQAAEIRKILERLEPFQFE